MTLPLLCLSCVKAAVTPTSYKMGVVSCSSPHKTTAQDRVVTDCIHCQHYTDARMEILTFTADQITLILEGRKNGTIRRTRHGQIGDTFAIAGITYRITSILSTYRGVAPMMYWHQEGCLDAEDHNNLLCRIYPNLTKDDRVYFHTFAAVIT